MPTGEATHVVNTLPKVAIAPLFLMWMGYGIVPNVLIGALIGFFPVVINTYTGAATISPISSGISACGKSIGTAK